MKNSDHIYGFFNFHKLYLEQIQNASSGDVFVEVGTLWGKSLAFLAQEIKRANKEVDVHSVDYWDVRGVPELQVPGADPTGLDYIKDGPDCIFNAFLQNMEDCGVRDIITPHRMSSEDGSKEFGDGSVDFLFIDAGHTYDDVKNDLRCWYPKVKPGKVISGHDYDWDGVKKAVDEFFGEENIQVYDTSWAYVKPVEEMYSFIVSYRNREDHLSVLLPTLHSKLRYANYEVLVVEQDDEEKFQKNSLYNLAAKRAKGSYLVFHDVDYIPTADVSYTTNEQTPLYPVRRVLFLNNDHTLKHQQDIPQGYQRFSQDVGDHSGGVFVISKQLFEKSNGLNPFYKGWGKEDDDTRDRLRLLGYQWHRNQKGCFYALDHADSKPEDSDEDFIRNHQMLANLRNTLHLGYNDVDADIEEFDADGVRWLKIKNFRYAHPN